MRRFARVFCAVALGLLLTSCSLTQLAYNNLDWLMYRKISRFVDLNTAQQDATKAAIATFHTWHRTKQLPLYAAWLDDFAAEVAETQLTGDDIHARIDEVQNFIDASMAELLPAAVVIMPSLSDQQVAEILKNIAEERDEYVDDYVDVAPEKLRKRRIKNLRDTMEPWLGKLTKPQKQWLSEWAHSLEPFEALNAEQQAVWQKDIGEVLAKRQDSAALLAGLEGLMFYRTDQWQPELEAVLDRNQARTYRLFARLLNEATPKQKQHFLARVAKFRADFLQLSQAN